MRESNDPQTVRYTPIETRLIELLSDGKGHPPERVKDHCYGDESEWTSYNTLRQLIFRVNKKLTPLKQAIRCFVIDNERRYTLVRIIGSNKE